MKYFIILFGTLFWQTPEMPYCTCMPLTLEEKVNSADIIFKGEVITVDTLLTAVRSINYGDDSSKREYYRPMEMTRTRLKVIETLKGSFNLDSTFVYTTWQCCMCGFAFWPDETYLVFAYFDTIRISKGREIEWDQKKLIENLQKPTRVLLTDICSGTDEFQPSQLDAIQRYLHRQKNSR
jgi:hypothetical protein